MTLTQTEIEELRIAIATEVGITPCLKHGNELHTSQLQCVEDDCWKHFVPPYTTSIDAIQAACLERFKIKSERDSFDMQLADMTRGESYIYQLTALDWSIAFARTAKIWRYKV
jgi:hypothetical protein